MTPELRDAVQELVAVVRAELPRIDPALAWTAFAALSLASAIGYLFGDVPVAAAFYGLACLWCCRKALLA